MRQDEAKKLIFRIRERIVDSPKSDPGASWKAFRPGLLLFAGNAKHFAGAESRRLAVARIAALLSLNRSFNLIRGLGKYAKEPVRKRQAPDSVLDQSIENGFYTSLSALIWGITIWSLLLNIRVLLVFCLSVWNIRRESSVSFSWKIEYKTATDWFWID